MPSTTTRNPMTLNSFGPRICERAYTFCHECHEPRYALALESTDAGASDAEAPCEATTVAATTPTVGDRVKLRVNAEHLGLRAGDEGVVVRVASGLIDVRFEHATILAVLPNEVERVRAR